MPESNPLIRDRDVDFVLYEVLDAAALCALPAFADHGRETFDAYLRAARRLAREVLFPAYRELDAHPPVLEGGAVKVGPALRAIFPELVGLGTIGASRAAEAGGQQLPFTVAAAAELPLMAANAAAFGYVGLTSGAAHLLESFGSDDLRRTYMEPMLRGEWTGTMALTEPQAGSSLADVRTRARPTPQGHYLLDGAKIFISGGDHDLVPNIVHLVLARIEGAPEGVKGLSLFAVPKRRPEGGRLVDNDVQVTGVIHKIGWRGLPSVALAFGEAGDCRGWLVGPPQQGLAQMFQMMNEARIMVGCHGVATASAAYHEARRYALERPQGRPLASRDPAQPQVPIVEHADVRRMLLRQKAIVEGGLALVLAAAQRADLAAHAGDEATRRHAQLVLEVLTPVVKSFPAEWGFEANALAVQVHGGYGYSSEYLPEAWLRDQKLNSIHEGTTGIQGLDLLGRKVVAQSGAALRALLGEIAGGVERARRQGVPEDWCARVERAAGLVAGLTAELGAAGQRGDAELMLRHSDDYLRAFSLLVVGWLWLLQAAAAAEGEARAPAARDFYEGKRRAAQYFLLEELPLVDVYVERCRSGDDSYALMRPESF